MQSKCVRIHFGSEWVKTGHCFNKEADFVLISTGIVNALAPNLYQLRLVFLFTSELNWSISVTNCLWSALACFFSSAAAKVS